jgi:hypothetical protein
MHTPTPDPREDEEEPDVKKPPVPPDQESEVVPKREPPDPAQTPLITDLGCPCEARGIDVCSDSTASSYHMSRYRTCSTCEA